MSFEKQEIKELIVAVIIAAFVFSFNEWGIQSFSFKIGIINLIRALLICTIIFPVRAYVQKVIARRFDCTSKFKLLALREQIQKPLMIEEIISKRTKQIIKYIGPLITVLVTLASYGRFILVLLSTAYIEPNKTKRVGRKYIHVTDSEFGQIALAGPATDLIILTIFKLLLPIAPLFFQKGMFIASALAIFHILPIPKMDGGQLFFHWKSLYIFAIIFTIIFIITIYEMTVFNTLMVSLILSGIISLFAFYHFYK